MKRVSLYCPKEIIALCDSDLNLAGVKSRNQFIIDAIKLYDCYLHKDINTDLLTPAFETVIDSRLDLTEYRLSQTIFKLAVEIACTMNVFAGAFKIEPEKVRNMKHRVINEVKSINGAIDFESIVKYQNGEL
ncbi:MAG: hypothetical protein ACI4HO_02635 [Ruminococcus sp.]